MRKRIARTRLASFYLSGDWECPFGKGPVQPEAVTPSRGLGDTIAKITKAVGIKPCGGCAERQAALNALVPYHSADLTTPGK